MTIVHRVDLPTPAPTILYGYTARTASPVAPPRHADAMFWLLARLGASDRARTRRRRARAALASRRFGEARGRVPIADYVACAQHHARPARHAAPAPAAVAAPAGCLSAAPRYDARNRYGVRGAQPRDGCDRVSRRPHRSARSPGVNEFGDIFNHHDVYEAVKRYNPYDNVSFNDSGVPLHHRPRRRTSALVARRPTRASAHELQHRSPPHRPRIDLIGGHTDGSRAGTIPGRSAAFLATVIGRSPKRRASDLRPVYDTNRRIETITPIAMTRRRSTTGGIRRP